MSSELRLFDRAAYEARAFWKQHLHELPKQHGFPADRSRREHDHSRSSYAAGIEEELLASLNSKTNQSDLLIYCFVLTALHFCLRAYSETNKTVIYSPAISVPGTLMPTCCEWIGEASVKEILLSMREQAGRMYEFQDEFEAQAESGTPDAGQPPGVALRMDTLHQPLAGKQNHVVVTLAHEGATLSFQWDYPASGYTEQAIARYHLQLQFVLRQMLQDVHAPVRSMQLIHPDELAAILRMSCGEPAHIPKPSLIELFEQQAAAHPGKWAIISREERISYGQLLDKVNQMTRLLLHRGVQPGQRVVIMASRNIPTMISILAAYKARATYVPVEPRYPPERQNYMIQDSCASHIIVTDPEQAAELSCGGASIIRCREEEWMMFDSGSFRTERAASAPVYMIYTSGTTGTPKGVAITDEDLSNLCHWYRHAFDIDHTSNIQLINPLGFDASVKNIFVPLMCGASIILGPDNLFDTDSILEQIAEESITHVNCVPQLFYAVLQTDEAKGYRRLQGVRHVVLGGERIHAAPLQPWLQSGACFSSITNVYGPTECTIISTAYTIRPEDIAERNDIPIGRPIFNKYVYVLDSSMKVCPAGVPGELYLSGLGTADGYFRKEAESSRSFIDHPFGQGRKLYRTGDIAKWTHDGQLMYLGRKDEQVKIQGFRVELSEIEAVLNTHPAIQLAIAHIYTDKHQHSRLACYYQAADNMEVSGSELRALAQRLLPEYMVPAVYIHCEAFPLNVNGKVDRAQLPPPEPARFAEESISLSEKPQTSVQETIASIWRNLLEIKDIGIRENFFDRGGYSLLLYKVSQALERELNIAIPVVDLLSYPTIQSLSQYIQDKQTPQTVTEEIHTDAERASKRERMLQQRKQRRKE
ncbi:hypothetical protein ABD76_10485 [Paenibacillus dendritiformis]|uniref:non-ribosomal peptide synthetase n=1 Tax=Paenibacillus dendritiformis TaxID=130049 RepID=UPI0018CEF69F|nr:non-ribosomal peptide synthetase [Paenibacillus dendritiformis]MBG9792894.1 hypothetical protein [Paenibacillus dendritiformis]